MTQTSEAAQAQVNQASSATQGAGGAVAGLLLLVGAAIAGAMS